MLDLLTPDDLRDLTGYRLARYQIKALRSMGIAHHVRLDGKPVVVRDALAPKRGKRTVEPDWGSII